HLRAGRRERREVVRLQFGSPNAQETAGAVGQDTVEVKAVGAGVSGAISKERCNSLAPFHGIQNRISKLGPAERRQLHGLERLPHAQSGKALGHWLAPRNAIASRRIASSGGGMYSPSSSTRAMNKTIGAQVAMLSR